MPIKPERKGLFKKAVKVQDSGREIHSKKPSKRPRSHVLPQESKTTEKTARSGTRITAEQKGKQRASAPAIASKTKRIQRPSAGDSPSVLPSTFKVVVGSYEKLLYGLEVVPSAQEGGYKFDFKPVFIFPAHISCVKAVAASPHGGKWLATGSADEIIKVWDLKRRKEIGGLMHHEGSITHLEFPSRSHLLSASEDGTLCLFHARDWSVLRTLKGHKGRVNSVAVHPSGKVGLSVGKDRTLRMWDLMRGKGSASTKLGKEGEVVRWSTTGSHFVVLSQTTLDIYSTDMTLLHTIAHPSRLHDVKFCKGLGGSEEYLLVAAEDKKLSIYKNVTTKDVSPVIIAEMIGHTNRVRAVETINILLPSSSPGSSRTPTTIITTISSDGKIHLYDLASVPTSAPEAGDKAQIQPVAEYDTKGTRLTCLTLADSEIEAGPVANGKRKREGDDDDENKDDDGSEEEPGWGGVEDDEHASGSEDEEEVEEEVEEDEEEGEQED